MSQRKSKLINLFKIIKSAEKVEISRDSVENNLSPESAFFITEDLFLKNLKGQGNSDKVKVPSVLV
jgi:hypothetical protein